MMSKSGALVFLLELLKANALKSPFIKIVQIDYVHEGALLPQTKTTSSAIPNVDWSRSHEGV